MRTTITLDDDVAATIDRLRKSRDVGLKQLVNEALREGLKQLTGRPRHRARYATRVVDLGRSRVGRLDNVPEMLAVAEGECFR